MWQTVTIFISSTFNDMQVERDMINRLLVPTLNQHFNPYKVWIKLIDLRWGINTEKVYENDREQHILDVCLQEIDRSRPFFIGLLGEKYGWIPPVERMEKFMDKGELRNDMSVTEMEITYGVLNNIKANKAVFCFRNQISSIPQEYLPQYVETDRIRENAIRKLKEKVRMQMLDAGKGDYIIDYDAKWENGQLKPNKNLIDDLEKVITAMIRSELSLSEVSEATTNMYRQIETILDTHCNSLILNSVRKDKLSLDLISVGTCLKITGPFRCGKSVLLAQTALRLGVISDEFFPIYYSTLADTECRNPMVMLNYFGYRLSNIIGQNWEEVLEDTETETLFFGTKVKVNKSFAMLERKIDLLCESCKAKGYIPIFLIDSVDMLIGERYRNRLTFANGSSIVIFTCSLDANINCTECYTCRNCDKSTVEDIISTALISEAKDLHHTVKNALIKRASLSNGTYSIGWLALALYWFINLDAKDFESIRGTKAISEEGKIETYFIELINTLPVNEGALFQKFVERNGNIWGRDFVSQVVSALALAPFGITERELASVVGDSWDELKFADFRRWMAPFISESKTLQTWQLKSASIREMLKEVSDKSFFQKMVVILRSLPETDPVRIQELPFYALAAGDYTLCASMLASFKANDGEYFSLAFSELTVEERINAGFNIINAAVKKDKPAVAAFIILMLFLRKNMIPIHNVVRFATAIIHSLNLMDYSNYEYALTCISVICSEISLISKNFGDIEDTKKISESLLSVGRLRYQTSMSFNAKQTLYKGLIAVASYYAECGEYEMSMKLYTELAELSKPTN